MNKPSTINGLRQLDTVKNAKSRTAIVAIPWKSRTYSCNNADLIRGFTNLRSDHPAFNGDISSLASDTNEWLVFERVSGSDRYLVLINTTANSNTYQFHEHWYPEYIQAELLFWSDGNRKEWKNVIADHIRLERSVFIPAFGLVVLRKTN